MSVITLDVNASLAERFRRLIRLYGEEKTVERFMDFQIKELKQEIAAIRKDLNALESQYNVKSEQFYQEFMDGKRDDRQDYMLWSGLFEMLRKSEDELRRLA